jgi:hypothetical protein
MTPQLSFDMHAEDSKILQITVKDANSGSLIDLSGCTAKWQMARQLTSLPFTFYSLPIVSKDTTSGIVITDPIHGVMQITLLPTDTSGLRGAYYHELRVTDTGGNEQTVLVGTITIYRTLIP